MYEVDQYTVSLLHFDDGLKDELLIKLIQSFPIFSSNQSVGIFFIHAFS